MGLRETKTRYMYIFMYVYMYIYSYICMYVYIYYITFTETYLLIVEMQCKFNNYLIQ